MASKHSFDRNRRPVNVGTRVRILKVAEFLKRDVPPDEWQRLETMVGEVLEVSEIDEYGMAWVEKWWETDEGDRVGHSVALDPDEMEVV